MKNIAIIQASAKSASMPGKILKNLLDKTVLEHTVLRVQACANIEAVFVAATINREDLSVAELCARNGVGIFCGSETDILDRFYQLAKLIRPQNIVKINADCPLCGADTIDRVLSLHVKEGTAYACGPQNAPQGAEAEVFTFAALKKAWENTPEGGRTVTAYMRQYPLLFPQAALPPYEEDFSQKQWALKTQHDYSFLRAIYQNLYPKNPLFSQKDVLELVRQQPHLERINRPEPEVVAA